MIRLIRLSFLVVALAGTAIVACGGGTLSVLHAKSKPKGDGPAHVDIQNHSGVGIHRIYVAKTTAVDSARLNGVQPGSGEDDAVWGNDKLGNDGLPEGHTFADLTLPADRYDVLVTDHDNREQLVKHLLLKPGAKYVLEVGDN